MADFSEDYNKKINNEAVFRSNIARYSLYKINDKNPESYIHLIISMFEAITLNGYKKVGVGDSSSVCSWLTVSKEFAYKNKCKNLFRVLRSTRNSMIHINHEFELELTALKRFMHATPYPIFEQCMNDLLLGFKDLYDMQAIYVKLGGDTETLPDDELRLFD